MKEKIDNTVNNWEDKNKITSEKEKKEWTRKRIESEMGGNPNIQPYKKGPRKPKFKEPDELTKKRMKLLDMNGNPIAGYKWGKFNKKTKLVSIVKDKSKPKKEKLLEGEPTAYFNILKFK